MPLYNADQKIRRLLCCSMLCVANVIAAANKSNLQQSLGSHARWGFRILCLKERGTVEKPGGNNEKDTFIHHISCNPDAVSAFM